MSAKKFCTAIYVIEYGNNDPKYVGFAISTKNGINTKINLLNKSLTKTYWLEHELVINNLFPIEMIVPIRKNAIYRLIYRLGPACNYVDEEVRNKVQNLSENL